MNILTAMDDLKVFGQHFKQPATWAAWRTFLVALFGLPMNGAQRRLFQECTGRERPPEHGATEAWLVIGRRGGKSFVLALIAVFLACFRDWRPYLGPGERATVMVLAADRKQARVIMRYVKALLRSVPLLARTIEAETQEALTLSHSVTIEIHTASFRTVRGYTIVAALLDEIAFWRDETSANPDTEILVALRPAMATVPNALLLCASSPYARRGALFDAFRRHYAHDDGPLVWKAPTRTMNPTVPQPVIDRALADDPAHAGAEWLAEFRSDIQSYIVREAVETLISPGVRERPPSSDFRYFAFVDPSGGSADSFTLAIAHREADTAVLDCLREVRPPFSPESVVGEFAALLKQYRVGEVRGDRYAGEWPREQFRNRGIAYWPSEKPKSDLYVDLLAPINSGRVALLDHDRVVAQLCSLERRTARSGKDSIDHPPNGHDDLANAVAGAVGLALARPLGLSFTLPVAPRLIELDAE
jgi:hypothetical protein